MTDKERIAELSSRLNKAYELIETLSGTTAEAVRSLQADQKVIEEMVIGLWQREGVEPINAWMDAEERLKEKGR